ncbi:MAG: hypothetical protein J1D77_03590 [Muribaculaceae bacterium]|nr:hypothetical protein [Muribaculaceae bacterium]
MDKQAQDKRWHRLSEREQAGWLENYKCNKEDGNKESMKIIEELFGTHNLEPQLTYEDVEKKLICKITSEEVGYMRPFGARLYKGLEIPSFFSLKQATKLFAINKLLNVAKFLNGKDWKPDFEDKDEKNKPCSLGIDEGKIRAYYVDIYGAISEIVFFKSMALAEQAVAILGEDTVRLALASDF